MRIQTLTFLTLLALTSIDDPTRAALAAADPSQRLAELEARNAELEAELARYRAGLERAVAELNRERRCGALRDPRPARPASSASASELQVVGDRLVSVARVRVMGHRATVDGEVRNQALEDREGTLTIELLRDGVRVDAVRLAFLAPARTRAPYEEVFELHGYSAGVYEARAYLEY